MVSYRGGIPLHSDLVYGSKVSYMYCAVGTYNGGVYVLYLAPLSPAGGSRRLLPHKTAQEREEEAQKACFACSRCVHVCVAVWSFKR